MSKINLDTCKFLVWGFKNVYHTHSHIHEGFYRALKLTGKHVDWLDETCDLSNYDLSNTLVITNHDCLYEGDYWPWNKPRISKLPIREDCFYVVHGLNDHKETREIFEGKNISLSWNVYNDYSKKLGDLVGVPLTECVFLDDDIPFYPGQKHLEFRWATDLIPEEIEKNKPDQMLSLIDKSIYWVGTIWQVNASEIGDFIRACKEDGTEFIHTGAGQKGVIGIEENISLVRKSYMAPAISGSHHLTEGYAPCRIFKNISYGQFGITNNKRVNDIFGGKLIYNPDSYKLYYEAKERLASMQVTELHSLMDEVAKKHTYLNRIDAVIKAIRELIQQ